MKVAIVFAAVCLALVAAAPPNADVAILRQDSDVRADGYAWQFEQTDGQKAQATGQLKNAGTDHAAIVATGSYEWTDLEGQKHLINYVADENGFQPEGADIPVA